MANLVLCGKATVGYWVAFVEDVPRLGGILVPPNDPKALAQALLHLEPHKNQKERVFGELLLELSFDSLAPRFFAWLAGRGGV
jgi:glycosyltransferase involved in cell wall biosynthesis